MDEPKYFRIHTEFIHVSRFVFPKFIKLRNYYYEAKLICFETVVREMFTRYCDNNFI